jgi:hypothetical protein
VGLVIFPSTGGVAQIDPIGGVVTGAGKAVFVHEGFQVINTMIVCRLPIRWQDTTHPTQDMRGQMGHANPGQYQKPAVVSHQMQIGRPLMLRPTDEPVAATNMPGGR